MTSHEYAGRLKELADFLLSKPEFETKQSAKFAYIQFYYWADKADFLAANLAFRRVPVSAGSPIRV